MAKNIIAIVQARMGSNRLPNKMMKDIVGKPLIQHVFERLSQSRFIDKIILATTDKRIDDCLSDQINNLGYNVYRGSENDVLDRYYQASLAYKPRGIVRISGDCPLIDPRVIDEVVDYFLHNNYDYVSNTNPPTFPDGLDVEVISFKALQKAASEANLMSEREHVVPYIVKNSDMFRISNIINSSDDLSYMRWTVDTHRDLKFVRKIFEMLYNDSNIFHMEDIVDLLDKNPLLMDINKGINRNEGYLLSLKHDRKIIKQQ